MTSQAVFAYGSLVDPRSAARTLGREPGPAVPAELAGWRRSWTTARDNLRHEKSFRIAAEEAGRTGLPEVPRTILLLNIHPDGDGPALNGALIPVDGRELALLDDRERRYRRIEVTGSVRDPSGAAWDRVHAYVALPRFHRAPPPGDGVAIAAYVRTVRAAFEALGEGQLERYDLTSDPPPGTAEAEPMRDRAPGRNPHAW